MERDEQGLFDEMTEHTRKSVRVVFDRATKPGADCLDTSVVPQEIHVACAAFCAVQGVRLCKSESLEQVIEFGHGTMGMMLALYLAGHNAGVREMEIKLNAGRG